jgi:hypothetical protein
MVFGGCVVTTVINRALIVRLTQGRTGNPMNCNEQANSVTASQRRLSATELEHRLIGLECCRVRLASRLAEISLEVGNGDVRHTCEVGGIREQLAVLDARIAATQRELAFLERESLEAEVSNKRKRFRETLEEMEIQRTAVTNGTRSASLALGHFHALGQEAAKLVAELGPVHLPALRHSQRMLDPFAEWSEIELVPADLDAGTIRVKPVRKQGE